MSNVKEEIESRFICPQCRGVPFILYRVQVRQGSEVFVNQLRPGTDGNHEVPEDRKHLVCPNCNVELRRE